MLFLIAAPGCASCRKMKQWLKEHDVPYTEKNLYRLLLDRDESELLIRLYKEEIVQSNDVYLNCLLAEGQDKEVLEYLKENPSLFERPLLYREKEMSDGIVSLKHMDMAPNSAKYCHPGCANWLVCGRVRHPERTISNEEVFMESQTDGEKSAVVLR